MDSIPVDDTEEGTQVTQKRGLCTAVASNGVRPDVPYKSFEFDVSPDDKAGDSGPAGTGHRGLYGLVDPGGFAKTLAIGVLQAHLVCESVLVPDLAV